MSYDYFLLPQGDNVIGATVKQLFRFIEFLPIQDARDIERSTQIYIRDIVQTHGISIAIFWQAL